MHFLILGTALTGIAVILEVVAGEEFFSAGIAYVEDDLRDKLRRLRVNTRGLHKWIMAWAAAVVGGLLGFTFALDSLPFGLLFAILLVCVPWYLVRRMAEKRRLRIEDQLADAKDHLRNGPGPHLGGVHGDGAVCGDDHVLFLHRPREHRAAVRHRSRPAHSLHVARLQPRRVPLGPKDLECRYLKAITTCPFSREAQPSAARDLLQGVLEWRP